MSFQNLTQVHTTHHTKRVQDNVDWTTIWQEWHIFYWNNFGNNTFVPMTSCHFVTYLNFANYRNGNLDRTDNTRREFIPCFSAPFTNIHYFSVLTVRQSQRGIFYIARLFSEDNTQQFFFWGQICFTLWSNFSNQNVTSFYLRTNTDYSIFV